MAVTLLIGTLIVTNEEQLRNAYKSNPCDSGRDFNRREG